MRAGYLVIARLAVCALGLLACVAEGAVPAITAGADRSCAISSSGAAYCWGDNLSGALGNGSQLTSTTPVAPVGLGAGLLAIVTSPSAFHTCAITPAREAWCWGGNELGELGIDSAAPSTIPVRVRLAAGVTAMATGLTHTCAILNEEVYCWGLGQAGGVSNSGLAIPTRVPGLPAGVKSVTAGVNHTCAVTNAGAVYCWGLNTYGQLGNGTTTSSATPVLVSELGAGVRSVSAGYYHTCALLDSGDARCWGRNNSGQLGNGFFANSVVPVAVSGSASPMSQVAAGAFHTCAINPGGGVSCWGANFRGQLGNGDTATNPAPRLVGLRAGAAALALGWGHSCALEVSGEVECWGDNTYGQLGNGDEVSRLLPVRASSLSVRATAITAGEDHTCALDAAGAALCWGSNRSYQLGDGQPVGFATPAQVTTLSSGIKAIATGGGFTCAVRDTSAVLCWGNGDQGELANGLAISSSRPIETLVTSGATGIAAGSGHACVLTTGGNVVCWGDNQFGQLGRATSTTPTVPDTTPLPASALAVAAGGGHTCAVLSGGSVSCWGANFYGQLGDGSTADSRIPINVAGLPAGAVGVFTGAAHSCAITSGGALYCWGANAGGQLGDGTTTNRALPVRVTGLPAQVVTGAAGLFHTCVLTDGGAVWCWGVNSSGQLGNGSATDSTLPIQVPGLASGVSAITAGDFHTCALMAGGDVRCWGRNAAGGLGDGTFAARLRDGVVVREAGAGSLAGNDWFLDLAPATPNAIPAERVPAYLVHASGNAATAIVDVDATVRFREQDVGTSASVYVFALAPASSVRGAVAKKDRRFGAFEKAEKDSAACVLAQLNASGQLQAVSTASLQAYVTGVLSGQGQAVQVLNGVPATTIGGATFYVGYGANPASMLGNGTNRSVVSVPGTSSCTPQAPATGWWWNPQEAGRGYSIEVAGRHLVFASYLYDISGRATWLLTSGNTSLDGSLFVGKLESYSGGQSLSGAYRAPTGVIGQDITLAFNDASHGTMIWPGGTVAIERFNIVPNGLTLAPQPNQPESGWWWNASESGRGYFLEWQGGQLFMAGYMYDDAGNPIWYLSGNSTPSSNLQGYSNSWLQFGNGQTLTGAYRAPVQVNGNVAPVTIQFSGAETGIMTLPGGRTTAIRRFRF